MGAGKGGFFSFLIQLQYTSGQTGCEALLAEMTVGCLLRAWRLLCEMRGSGRKSRGKEQPGEARSISAPEAQGVARSKSLPNRSKPVEGVNHSWTRNE